MVPLIAGVMEPECILAKTSISFQNIALNSSSQNIKWIWNMVNISEHTPLSLEI